MNHRGGVALIQATWLSWMQHRSFFFILAFNWLIQPLVFLFVWATAAGDGTISGLTRGSNRGHIARATLDAMALQNLDILLAMEKDLGRRMKPLRVDGGAAANNLLMQIQADVLNVPVIRPRVTETTALGAAYAAGLATGYWSGLDELRRNWQEDRAWQGRLEEAPREQGYLLWQLFHRTTHLTVKIRIKESEENI